jgi:hypothetical protein
LSRGSVSRGSLRGAILGALVVAGTPPTLAATEWRFQGQLDVRLVASDADRVWLDAGLDKLRFAEGDEPAALGSALLDIEARLAPTFSAHVTTAAYDGIGAAIDVTEAYAEIAPVPRSAYRFRGRIGAFYPPGTLENRSFAWTTPYTLSFSAIDSWYAEELRAVGVEGSVERMGRFTGSPDDFALSFAAFRYNDPAGAMLAWRGWALHDRQTGLFERLPLAPLPNFAENGLFYPVQGAFDEPFVEIDGRTGFYVAGEWRHLDRSLVRAVHYDNRGDPTVVEGGQWAWLTKFDRLGWQWKPTGRTDLVAQALVGSTRMDGFDGPLVYNDFRALSVLVSHAWTVHRASLRYDRFSVDDQDSTPDDPNDEDGEAWTAAWIFAPRARWLSRLPAGAMYLSTELLHVESRREARVLLGDPPSTSETQVLVAVQWRFPG